MVAVLGVKVHEVEGPFLAGGTTRHYVATVSTEGPVAKIIVRIQGNVWGRIQAESVGSIMPPSVDASEVVRLYEQAVRAALGRDEEMSVRLRGEPL